MSLLSDSEGEQDDLNLLTINEHYAKAFEYKKERQELEKLKAKYGSDYEEDDISESDSESDESEDEDGEELTPAVDAAILRTLARIKRKDPEIYDSKTNIFQAEQQKLADVKPKTRPAKDKSKPVTMRQVALENALDRGSRTPSPEPVTHVEEQRALRDETIAAFHTAVDSADDEDDLLIPREKTKDELEREEEEYRTFLEREVGEDLSHLVSVESAAGTSAAVKADAEEEESPKKKKKKEKKKAEKVQDKGRKSKEEEDHEFLMNYILNRGWMDRESKRIPTYKEVTSSKKDKGKQRAEADSSESESDASGGEEDPKPTADPDIDESDFEEIVDRFESSYNFRFEEPDAATIKTYPRNIETTVRREENPRKEARERKKQRKEEELQRKREEVRRLKALKMKEIRAKLDRIGREGGKDLEHDAALQELDLEADWDPEAHDRQMAGLYGDDFEGDEEKPTWDDDIDIGDIPMSDDDAQPALKKDKKKKKKKKKGDDGDMDADGVDIDAMDADAPPPEHDDEEWDGTEEMRKRKLDEYMDELYGLDFNDMVGGMPTRFRYVNVPKQDFSLTPAEILMATDKELNEYMSIKKYAPYKRDNKWDPKRPDKIRELRHKIGERTGGRMPFAAGGEGGQDGEKKKKRKGKSERKKAKAAAGEGGGEGEDVNGEEAAPTLGKREREEATPADVAGDGQAAKKRKRKHKKKEVE
ncbi:KRI1-like family C-terminal-domain-containing protein [Schizophyllum commune]